MRIRKILMISILVYVALTRLVTPSYLAYAFRDVTPLVPPQTIELEGKHIVCDWDLVTMGEAVQDLDFLLRVGVCWEQSDANDDGDDDDDDDDDYMTFAGGGGGGNNDYGDDDDDDDDDDDTGGSHSGLGDGTNPGQGSGNNNAGGTPGGTGTDNPGGQ